MKVTQQIQNKKYKSRCSLIILRWLALNTNHTSRAGLLALQRPTETHQKFGHLRFEELRKKSNLKEEIEEERKWNWKTIFIIKIGSISSECP